MCVLGVEGSEKKCTPPKDNFWNSPYINDCVVGTKCDYINETWVDTLLEEAEVCFTGVLLCLGFPAAGWLLSGSK